MQLLERLSAKTRLPEWAVALTMILAVDAVLAASLVAIVPGKGTAGSSENGRKMNDSPKVWTLAELQQTYQGRPIQEVMDAFQSHPAGKRRFDTINGRIVGFLMEDFPLRNQAGDISHHGILFKASADRCLAVEVWR